MVDMVDADLDMEDMVDVDPDMVDADLDMVADVVVDMDAARILSQDAMMLLMLIDLALLTPESEMDQELNQMVSVLIKFTLKEDSFSTETNSKLSLMDLLDQLRTDSAEKVATRLPSMMLLLITQELNQKIW